MGTLRITAPAVPLELEMGMHPQEERGDATEEVPTGTLIDMQDEAEEAYVHQPAVVVREVEVAPRAAAALEPVPTPAPAGVHIEPEAPREAGFERKPRRRRSTPAETPVPSAQVHGQQAHLRAPEAPRHPPPRALSALSHTLRALAASTQAVTSTATAYAQSHSYLSGPSYSPHSQRATAQPYDAREGGHEDEEPILGARWDEVLDGSASPPTPRRLLTLTYAAGVQIWDTTALGGVSELLNLRIQPPTPIAAAAGASRARSSVDTLRAVEASPVRVGRDEGSPVRIRGEVKDKSGREGKGKEGEAQEMHGPILGACVLPLTGVGGKGKGGKKVTEGGLDLAILTPHALYIYALNEGRVVAQCSFPLASPARTPSKDPQHTYGGRGGSEGRESDIGLPCEFAATERVVVVTTHNPPALVILERPSLSVLHIIPASALAVRYLPSAPPSDTSSRRSSYAGASPPFSGTPPPYSHIHSNPTTSPPNAVPVNGVNPTSPTPPPPPTPTFALHGRLLAFLAPAPTASSPIGADAAPLATWGRSIGRFFSRSAPAATAIAASVFAAAGSPPLAGVASAVGAGSGSGADAWVRVVDLGGLWQTRDGQRGQGDALGLRDVHAFEAGRAAVDGLGAGVWVLRPLPSLGVLSGHQVDPLPAPAQVYALRRGRTGAVVEAVASARDGRFVALATRRRTVHVFAVNPYGGRADVRSHLGARVRDAEIADGMVGVNEGQMTEVHALVRIRLPSPKQQHQHQPGGENEKASPPAAPLAITFVSASTNSVGTGLRSPVSPSSPTSTSSGVQDVLVFDPADGVLSLRRITLALEVPHPVGLPISVSLPAARMAGLSMSASPPGYVYAGVGAPTSYARGHGQHGSPGGASADTPGAELGGREAVVATWSLRRRRGWAEIRRTEAGELGLTSGGRPVKQDWLAQAELSTFASAPRVLPRAIYLSHQFSFHTLGEDYHALIRRYQFAIGGAKIEVRREVEVSAFSNVGTGAGSGEAFVEGFGSSSSPREIRRRSRASSSFDEPLASALAGVAHYRDVRPPPVLPMLPNGSPSSFRSSMPVRAVAGLGDGVAEGLGRLRREMRHQRQKQLARSPPVKRTMGGGGDDVDASVPLEFDEEDEDFAVPPNTGADEVFLRVHADREDDDALSSTSRNEESVASISTPATSAHPLEDEERMEMDLDAGEGEWHGWAPEDKLAVEEAEGFDDISVVGFLDEEQAAMQAEAARRKNVAAAGLRGRKKRRS
ncbi:hypothetical protein B0H16DRAFT_1624929 [Mycena metata]|uniref:BCAS3 WD40 domain-containing protein n=1 Tax=Mycena metata TaxID=1033252 RepID=A0AAD7MDL3_9AGAR|nr:hypothetical protein B0H16DRAFT_1624929 [Mycena metata]